MNRQKVRCFYILFFICFFVCNSFNSYSQNTYYSYIGVQNSSWHNPNTWTTTPGGFDSQDAAVPGPNDIVHIVGNRNVVLNQNVTTTGHSINIEAGSTLTIGIYTFAAISQLNGQGSLVIKSSYFPTIATNNLVLPGGGTVEYADFTGVIPTGQTQYNNLQFNITDNNDHQFIVNTNLTVSGNLVLLRSSASGSTRLTIGNAATVRNIGIAGDVNVSANTRMDVGSFNAVHEVTVGGNLENNGELYLTNGARYTASTNGAANITFTGATNNTVTGTGTTARFYRLIVDKGLDQTFILDVNPSAFELWYRTDLANGGADPNPIINKALWIKNGTLKLGSNISIPKLADQDAQASGNDFFIPLNGALWIDGATVNVTDADGSSGNTGLTVIGRFRISDGVFNGNKSAGIVFRGTADITIEGGEVNISQFRRSTAAGVQIASYNQSGGVVNVTGNGETNGTYPRFSLELGTHSFIMSGGNLNLQNPSGAGILAIGSGPGYFNVTGGTININNSGTNLIASTVPFFNLNVNNGTLLISDISAIGLQPLKVINELYLGNSTTLNVNDQDLWIAGNLVIETGVDYIHGINTTRFYRHGAVNNSGTIITNNGSSSFPFNNVSFEKADPVGTFNIAKTVVFPVNGTPSVNILGSISFDSPYQTLDLNNRQIRVHGNISVNQTSRILNDPADGILLQPAIPTAQRISIGKLTSANNFELNNTAGARLMQTALMGSLKLTNGALFIGNKRLTLNQPVAGTGFSSDKMISTNGASGELRYIYKSVGLGTYLYPVGAGADPLAEGEEELDWSEDFSRNVFATAPLWTSTPISGTSNWNINAGSARFNAANTHETRMATPVIDLTGYSTVQLIFREQRPRSNGQEDRLIVEYYNGSAWVVLATYTNRQDAWIERTIILPPAALISGFRLGFRALSNHNNTVTRVDDVQLTNIIETGDKKYTPFTNIITGAGTFTAGNNYIGVIPLNKRHPLYIAGFEDQTLLYYWKTSTSGSYTGTLNFEYLFNFFYEDRVVGGGAGAKRPFKLISNLWTGGNNADYSETFSPTDPRGRIRFPAVGFTQGDFTAGTQNAFASGGGLTTYFSRNATSGGNWETAASWSTDEVLGHAGAAATGTPGISDQVIIAPNHTITITTANRRANVILINSAGVLNVGTLIGHEFEQVRGDGTFRIASGTLPVTSDDYNEFCTTDNSTFEFYGTTNYTIPNLPVYYNLFLSGTGTKTLANVNLNVRNNLQASASTTVILSDQLDGNLDIEGELQLTGGSTLTIPVTLNTRTINTQNIIVENSVFNVASGAGTTHSINISEGGVNVTGTGSVILYQANNNVNLTLSGPGNTSLGSNGNAIRLNRLIVNKPSLFEEVSVTAYLQLFGPTNGASKALELIGGTFIIERTDGASNVDITLTSGGADFFLPSDAALIMRGSPANANIIRTTGASGIFLDGMFSLSGNAQALFNGAANYIQYGSSGQATIEITQNAVLNIGGQLRRSVSGTTDALNYFQDGGEVLIGTQGAPLNTRGVFEILNSSSSFTHLDGFLDIARSSGYPGGDIYLDPENYEIGADATLTIEAIAGGQNIQLRSSVPLNNLDIKGTNNPTVTLNTLPLFLEGNMNIETGSTFNTSNLSQTYQGNFTKAGTYVPGTADTAYFRGVTQVIQGATTFNHLVIEPEVSVTLNGSSSITVNKNMAVLSGELVDGGNTIDIKGNLTNYALHTSSNPAAGGILLSGTVLQIMDGNGTFGRMEINNTSGVRLNSSINLNNNLLLTNGIFNIQNNRLQLNAQSTIVGAGFGITKMIQTGGDIGDLGLRKYHSTGVSSFTYPIGSPGKYTPVSVNITANTTEAYIEIAPVNYAHPTITPPSGDPNRVLQYFWKLNSDATNMSLATVYQYIDTDVRGNESAYYSAQLNTNTDTWLKLSTGVDPLAHTVTFNQSNASSLVLNGIYTAGEETAIPDNVTEYTAIASGAWDTPTNWDLGVSPPSGVVVTIPDGIQIRINSDRKRLYRINLFGRLEINPSTTFHNLGILTGTGTLALENDFLPPGTLDAFLSCAGGTMEYGGPGPYTITNRYSTFRNLVITGSGVKILPDIDITICNDLLVEGTSLLKNSGTASGYRYLNINGNVLIRNGSGWEMAIRSWVNLYGNLIRESSTTFNTNFSTQFFEIRGNGPQQIVGDFTGISSFNNLRFNNLDVLSVSGLLDIRVYGYLFNGQVDNIDLVRFTRPVNGLINLSSGYFTGEVQISMSSVTPIKTIPVGKGTFKKFIYFPTIVTTGNYKGEYMDENPDDSGYDPTQMAAPLTMVSAVEYWVINGPNGGTAQLRLPLTGTSDVAAASSDLNNLRIARWSGTQWEIVGTGATYTPTINNGFVTTTANVTFNGTDQVFTLATIDPTLTSTAQFTSGNVSICAGGFTVLTVEFTGTSPWNFSYTDGVTTYNETNVTSPFNINVSPAVTRTYTLTAVSDINGAGTIFGSPVIVTVHPTPAPFNLTGGGSYCMGAAIPVGLSGSQIGMTYELLQDAAPTGIAMAGSGAAISFSGVTQAGTYTVRGFNTNNPACEQMMTGSAIVVVNPLPTASISVIPPLDFICSEEYTRFSVALTGSSPWSITYTDGTGTWTRNGILTNPYEFDSDEALLWIDEGAGPAPRSINFTITSVTDSNCTNTGSGAASVNVYRRPETGPQYHIPNIFN